MNKRASSLQAASCWSALFKVGFPTGYTATVCSVCRLRQGTRGESSTRLPGSATSIGGIRKLVPTAGAPAKRASAADTSSVGPLP